MFHQLYKITNQDKEADQFKNNNVKVQLNNGNSANQKLKKLNNNNKNKTNFGRYSKDKDSFDIN